MAHVQLRFKTARRFQTVTIRVPDAYEYYNLKMMSHLVHGMPLEMAIFTKVIKPLGDKAERLEKMDQERPEDMQVYVGNAKVLTGDMWSGPKHYLFGPGAKEYLCPCSIGEPCLKPERTKK